MATYIGKTISLISKAGIRYEGILYTIDPSKSTVALSKVKSFGTENRPVERFIPSRDEIFEYIIFRGSDIQDLSVCENSLYNDDSSIVKIVPQNPPNIEETHDQSGNAVDDRVFINSNYHQISEGPQINKPELSYTHNEQIPEINYDKNSKAGSNERDDFDKVAKNDYQTFINREYNTYRRGWGHNRGARGGRGGNANPGYVSGVFGLPRNNKPHGNPSNNRKSEVPKSDFDFESSNALIADELANIHIDENVENNPSDVQGLAEKIYYDKQKSFFDNISSDRQQQTQDQRRNDRQLNNETFGEINRDNNYRRGGGNYFYRGGFNNRGGNSYRRNYNNYNRGGGFSYRGNNYRGYGHSQQHGFIRRGSSNWRRGGIHNAAMGAGFASDSSKRGGMKMPRNGTINAEGAGSAHD